MHDLLVILTITCSLGFSKCEMESFVVNGEDAKKVDFPYTAFYAVHCRNEDGLYTNSWVCGSSIVNQYILLTAAHCMSECSKYTSFTVSVGSAHVFKGANKTAHGFIIHENYCDENLINDIALIKLKTPLKFNSKVRRVAFMPTPPYQEEALVAGWGIIDEEKRKKTNILKFTKQTVRKERDCLRLLHSMPKGTFCAANKDPSSYASSGDSGSALVAKGYIQLGLVSCKDPVISASVVIYTDVGYFYKWIKANTEDILCL